MTQSNDNPYRRRAKAPLTEADREKAHGEAPLPPEKLGDHGSFRAEPRDGTRPLRRGRRGDALNQDQPGGGSGVQAPTGERRGLRQLPRDLQELADGRADKLRRPKPAAPSPIEDERIGFVFAGVRNMDARNVYDARVDELRAASARGDRELLASGLCDAARMQVWRARNVLDFAAFAEHVVGIAPAEAERLARVGAERAELTLDVLPPHVVALWMRTEAALARACPDARITVRGTGSALTLQLLMPVNDVSRAVLGFFDMGGAANGLRPFLREDAPAGAERPVRDPRPQKLARDNERGGSRKPREPRKPRE